MTSVFHATIDFETLGLNPATCPVLSFGAVQVPDPLKYKADDLWDLFREPNSFYTAIHETTDRVEEPTTRKIWESFPSSAWAAATEGTVYPSANEPRKPKITLAEQVAVDFSSWIVRRTAGYWLFEPTNIALALDKISINLWADPVDFDGAIYRRLRGYWEGHTQRHRIRVADVRAFRAQYFKVPYMQANRQLYTDHTGAPYINSANLQHHALEDAKELAGEVFLYRQAGLIL